ncbi:MAG TPA: nucleotidyltransferase family protein [Steroidobacteraceae bacterium]|nr:nucleotidyltransferase family protein [Steroidobacteraceae bacterium]
MIARDALPSFTTLRTALHLTTERLARELVQPSGGAPDWSDLEWSVARAAAAMQGIAALLAISLRWKGPAAWEDFLGEQLEQSARRYERIGWVLARIDAAARRHGVPVVALKGAALREFNLQRVPGERPMGDIDLLARPEQLEVVARALQSIGYEFSYASRRHQTFKTPQPVSATGFGERALNPIPIEVHTVVAEALPFSAVDITARLWPAETDCGIHHYSSNGALLCHLLLHCAGNMRAHALRLSQLRDVAQLSARLTTADWQEFLGAGPRTDLWWIYPPLALSARYFPGRIPAEIVALARRNCPALLRRAADRQDLTAVSWSNLRIDAFPGIEWSRAPLEALRYAKSRFAPSKVALDDLEYSSKTLPQLRTVPWYGQRHATRILRWLFTRPPRVQTISSVLEALSAQPRRDRAAL